MKLIRNFINGEFTSATGGKIFDKRSPLNNLVIAQVREAGQAEVDAAVAAARAALKGPWGGMTMAERVDMLYAVANEINRRFDDFLAAEVRRHRQADEPRARTSTSRAVRPTSRSSPTW